MGRSTDTSNFDRALFYLNIVDCGWERSHLSRKMKQVELTKNTTNKSWKASHCQRKSSSRVRHVGVISASLPGRAELEVTQT